MSADGGIDTDVVHIHHGVLLSHKKEQKNVICSHMDRPRDYQAERNKSEKDKYHVTYMWDLNKGWYRWAYLQNRN